MAKAKHLSVAAWKKEMVKRLAAERPRIRPAHSLRHRAFGNGYPRLVAEAATGDIVTAMRSTDKQVARRVLRLLRREGGTYATVQRVIRIAEGRSK